MLDQSLDTWSKQSVPPDEVIIVDDGSNPPIQTPVWADRIRVREGGKHRGSSHAKNEGAKLGAGHYLVFADAEILVAPDTLESLLAAAKLTESEGQENYILNVARTSLPYRIKQDETQDMNAFISYSRRVGWIDGVLEDLRKPVICYEHNCSLIRRKYFWSLNGYDSIGFPGWGFNNHDLDLRIIESGGYVSSDVKSKITDRRLICFHNWHEAPIDKQTAKDEFTAKWGEEFSVEFFRRRLLNARSERSQDSSTV